MPGVMLVRDVNARCDVGWGVNARCDVGWGVNARCDVS